MSVSEEESRASTHTVLQSGVRVSMCICGQYRVSIRLPAEQNMLTKTVERNIMLMKTN